MEKNKTSECSKEFSDGAKAFRSMLLDSLNPIVWPHIEGVFNVFSKEHGFEYENESVKRLENRR